MRSVTIAFTLVCLLGPALPTHAQDLGGIQGRVIDAETGEPLPFVNISVVGTVIGGITNRYGEFHITNVPVGERQVMASMMGYETGSIPVVVGVDHTVNIDFELAETALHMEEVVVTGTRLNRYVKDVPVRTEVMTRKSIENAGACDIYEALEGAPGVRVEQQCQFCNFTQVRMLGLGADHTQVLVDGQPVYSGLASVYGLQQIGTASIDRIEVMKGAGSSLYGSGAIAGAINLITRTPRPQPEGGFTVELGEHATNRYEFSASQQFGSAGLVVFAQRNTGDAIDETGDGIGRSEIMNADGVTDRVKTDLTSGGFNAIFDGAAGMDRVTLRGMALHETRQGGELYNGDYEIPDDVYENPFTPGTEQIVTDRYEAEISGRRIFEGGDQLNVSVAYARHDRDATNDTFVSDYESIYGELPSVDLLRPYLAAEDIWAGNADYARMVGGRHRLLGGVQVTHDRLEESGMYIVVDEDDEHYGVAYRSTSEKHATDMGVYLQDEYAASDALDLVLGVRYDHHSSEDNFHGSGDVAAEGVPTVEYNESSFNPRAAVRFNPTERVALRASVGTGFRVPYGFSEDLHLCSGSPRVWKPSGLKPEKSTSYALSADYYGERTSIGVTLYRVDVRDKVGLSDAGEEAAAQGYTYEWENVDDAYVQGVEVEVRHRLAADLAVDAYGTVADGEYENARDDWEGTEYENDSAHISRLPKYTAGVTLEYRPLKWSIVAKADIQGPLYIDYFANGEEPTAIVETDPAVTIDAKVSREVFRGVSLFVGGRNLTDYVQEEKHTDDAAFMYGPVYGRIIYGGISVDF